jgi:hypothetical protein
VLSHDGQLTIARPLRQHAVRAARRLNDPVLLARAVTALDVPRVPFFRELMDAILKLHDQIANATLGARRDQEITEREQARLRMNPLRSREDGLP